jgi:hypothetical protein
MAEEVTSNELLEKVLIVYLNEHGYTQQSIARFLGKGTTYVNDTLKPLQKRKDA